MDILLDFWNSSGPLAQFIAMGIVLYLVSQGIIHIPWLNLKKKKEGDGSKIADHEGCDKFPPLEKMVMAAIEKSAEIQRIQINESINEQMNEADDLFVDVRETLKVNYLTLYKPFNKDKISGLLQCKEVKCYLALIDNAEKQLKGMARRFIKKNHFLERTEAEFRIYMQERTGDFQQALTQYLDEHYITDDFKISREELFESNIKNCMPEIARKVESFFYRIRDIAKVKQDKIDKLKADIGAFL